MYLVNISFIFSLLAVYASLPAVPSQTSDLNNRLMKKCILFFLLIFGIISRSPIISKAQISIQCAYLDSCDLSDNDPALWNHPGWWDAANETHDLAEKETELLMGAKGLCSTATAKVRWRLFLDLNNDGIQETVAGSDISTPDGMVAYNNVFQTGTLYPFDANPSVRERFRFVLVPAIEANDTLFRVQWEKAAAPGAYVNPHLPAGRHRMEWSVGDGCSPEQTFSCAIFIQDCKEPDVVCKPLSVNMMQTGRVTLWYSDFLSSAQDNVTPEKLLQFSVEKREQPSASFPLDSLGRPYHSIDFQCNNMGPNPVNLWVRDKNNNSTYCRVIVLVNDDLYNCNVVSSGKVRGKITVGSCCLQDYGIFIEENARSAYIPLWQIRDGCGFAVDLPSKITTKGLLTPVRDDNPLNGVTTLDLALINNHILARQIFKTPYQYIAADANKSGTVTVMDINVLQMLILGVWEEFPNNNSWRFVRASYKFPNPANPFIVPFPESMQLDEAPSLDFTAIKVGDINGTAICQRPAFGPPLAFGIADRFVRAGEVFELRFESDTLLAQQGTFYFPQLELLDILPGNNVKLSDFAHFQAQHQLTHAWYAEKGFPQRPVFSLRFKAVSDGQLSEMLQCLNSITPSLAYDKNELTHELVLRFTPVQTITTQCSQPNGDDVSDNDPAFWNHPDWWDSLHKRSDLAEKQIPLSLSATDICALGDVKISYELLLDLNGDGVQETLVHSDSLNPANTVYVGNAGKNAYKDGKARAFDQRPALPDADRYRFALEQLPAQNGNTTASVRFNTQNDPSRYVDALLPYGTHRIRWVARDACGNSSVCEQTFTIKDKKAPEVLCKPLAINMLSSGSVSVFAADFLDRGLDNATAEKDLTNALSVGETAPAQFPVNISGNPVISATFTCSNLGPSVVQLWARDLSGNASYCQVVLLVQDNLGNCVPQTTLTVHLETEVRAGIPNAQVEIVGNHPASPPMVLLPVTTDTNGNYIIPTKAFPFIGPYTITPTRDDNPLNGVTTLDLALISRHILNQSPLNSPYKMIAADVNKSGTITTLDVIALRRIILGIDEELANNASWRFVLSEYAFPNIKNPFSQPFPEKITVPDITTVKRMNFIGMKTGDVNGTARPNNLQGTASGDRHLPPLSFAVADRFVDAGEVFDITLESDRPVLTQQFTLEHPGLMLLDLQPGTPDMTEDHFARFTDRKMLTHAWTATANKAAAASTRFTLRFRAEEAGFLSDKLRLTDQITASLAYETPNEADVLRPVLQFVISAEGSGILNHSVRPNPWSSAADLVFTLPVESEVRLLVMDASGKMLMERKGNFNVGTHTFSLSDGNLPTGLLYYRLVTPIGSVAGKMTKMK